MAALVSKWGLLRTFVKELRRLNENLDLIARAQCKIARIDHPELATSGPGKNEIMKTDRKVIEEIRREKVKELIYGREDV